MSSSHSGSASSSEGSVLVDRYRVDDPLGRGRYTVYRGEDTRLRRRVAIKEVPLAEGQEDAERLRLRAMREAHAAARLNNPNVVTVYDVVEEGGSIWLVMELVDALSLTQLVDNQGPLPHGRAARIGLAVLNALRAAHAVGVVHRDVKPANVLVGKDDHSKLADFGVATIRDESKVTKAGSIIGSPSYMAPEQAMASDVGPPADLWALGATLYFAVEGKAPFTRDSAIATAAAVVHNEPDPQQNRGPLSDLIERLLDKEPERRPEADQVRTMLAAAAADESPDSSSSTAATSTTATTKISPIPGGTIADDGPAERNEAEPADDREPSPVIAPQDETEPARAVIESLLAAHPSPTRNQRVPMALVGVLAVVILAGIGLLALISDDDQGDAEAATSDSPAQEEEASSEDSGAEETPTDEGTETEQSSDPPEAQESTTTTSEPAEQSERGVPEGWVRYENPEGAYVIARPEGWRVEPADGPRVDFRDPSTGAYLRVDWTSTPKDDPVADWRSQAQGYASRHEGYQQIRIEPYDYRDYNAAMWEFRYRAGGTQLHVGNLGFVTGGRGYALLFQAPEQHWEASRDTYATFRETFRPK